jgi:lipoprotein Spr
VISCGPAKHAVTLSGESLPEKPHPVTVSGESLRAAAQVSGDFIANSKSPIPIKSSARRSGDSRTDSIMILDGYDAVRLKFAASLHVDPSELNDPALYRFIDRWLNTPYKWGGTDERGIDCSAFLQKLFGEVYSMNIPRTSIQQFLNEKVERFKSPEYLTEGDLVFFRTVGNQFISHVGLYLHNGIFVNSSSSRGVSLANLHDAYWKKRYVASGRLKMRIK